ncbi:protein SABRE [Cinnamomum micranthum f. kanehirae]|uniref:Protein SABRE n=1 Tax=Cinnamomum micranthum f. kanehirae TaxID=337451 RepID=A0A443NFL7_9MAGN|nr:protein SABRE [Cinnamomum micranthum f. kanehirae]
MALSPVKFFFSLLIGCAFGWIFLILTARLLAIFLSRVVGVSVAFRVAGCNCLRDVIVQFKKGAVESISIGEVKLCLRKSLVKLGSNVISREPKLQLLIFDFEIVTRPSEKKLKARTQRPRSTGKGKGKGKWMVVANMARFLSVSVTELVVKVPKATIEIKDLVVDISKHGRSLSTLCVKLHLLPFLVHMGDSRLSYEQSSTFNQGEGKAIGLGSVAMMERNSAYFICEELSLTCEFSHEREVGATIKDVDIMIGEVTVNLNDELFVKKTVDTRLAASLDSSTTRKSQKKENLLQSFTKYALGFPEKVSFNLPKLDVRFVHQVLGFSFENNVTGIHLSSSKSQSLEESGEATSVFNVQMDFSEIHLLRGGGTSVLAITKLAIVSSFDVPSQLTVPIRAKIDVKIGVTQCHIIMSRLKPWMRLHMSKKKRMVLPEEKPNPEKSQKTDMKVIMWTCNVSAPEITIVLYSLNGLPLYQGCSQALHLFANNIATLGIAVHSELGELHLCMADEHQECLKENLFGVETDSGSLMHIARASLDWGHKEIESPGENDSSKLKLVLSVDVTDMGINISFKCVESLISTAMTFQSLLKSFSASKKRTTQSKVGRPGKPAVRGTQVLKFNLDQCSINFSGDVGVENAVVKDPKRVNFGSQGGEVIISVSADGTPRTANVASTISNGSQNLKYLLCLDIFHFSLCLNKEKRSTQMDLERARSIYQECCEEHKPDEKVTLLDTQNVKFVHRSGGNNEMAVCSLFSATDISVRWEPDVHLSLCELILRLRCLIYHQKLKGLDSEINEEFLNGKDTEPEREAVVDPARSDKQNKKKDAVFAIDVEMLSISAEAGDGVEAMIQVQSIFSENAKIGVLLEGFMLCLNEARVFKSSRMQISRVPKISTSNSSIDSKVQVTTTWDWIIQGLDVHICMPYRLQLRAIEDSIEEMSRGLKLITAAKTALIFPVKKESSKQPKTKSTKLGRVRLIIRKISVDIEEEPLQGWLDEHYQLMKKVVCELAVRLKFLDEIDSEGDMGEGVRNSESTEPNELCSQKKVYHNGIEIDVHDSSSVQKLREEVHKQAFRSYYEACQKLVSSEGSGACETGFQAGFKPSTSRISLLSLCATELDVTLTKIEGDSSGMIEFIKKLDPIALENDIPFSRMLGKNIVLRTGTLAAHIRNYTYPILFATAGKCEGRIVLAQQATSFQPQIQQDVFVGRWRKVCMLRSASGTTPPMKTYADLPLCFQKAEISFGVGFEPVLTDVSYAFTVALRRANLSVRSGDSTSINNLVNQPPKKERSLPWWDEVRNYIHGKYVLCFTETRWNILGTTDPYEKLDKLQIVSGSMEIQHSDGLVSLSAQDFQVFATSLESLNKRRCIKLPLGSSGPFLESPSFRLEVNMDWECDSGNPLNHYLYALPNEKVPREKVYDPFRSTSLSLRWNFSLGPLLLPHEKQSPSSSMVDESTIGSAQRSEHTAIDSPTMNVGAHDLAWVFKFWNLCYLPPQKLRTFSRWPRFGVPRVARSGNLSLDKVMTEFMLRFDVMPICIKHTALEDDDPASGLTIRTKRFKYELCFSRGKQVYTFDCKRDTLDLVYQGVDLYTLKVYLNKYNCTCIAHDFLMTRKSSQTAPDRIGREKCKNKGGCTEKHHDNGFLLSSNYFTIRKQAPKADPARLLEWQEAGRTNFEMTHVRSEFENGNDSDHDQSDPSDDDEFNVVVADNCQRVFVYGLKLLWTLNNRDAVLSWVGGISKAFQPPTPSPSRQYAQRKLIEEKQRVDGAETLPQDNSNPSPLMTDDSSLPSSQNVAATESDSSVSPSVKTENSSSTSVPKSGRIDDSEEDGTHHFMVNVYEPQFNLHSEEANGRFLLAAVSGCVLTRSFHSVLNVGYEVIEEALGTGETRIPESGPEMTWQRMEFSVMWEHVQAHVAPTDVDPGAGVQWLPKIRRSSPKVKRTGTLLERVFRPCTMYFRYTRHKGGNADLKMKPLKELAFNSPDITASMTSRQFQVMLDVLTNLLFARLPKPRKSCLSYGCEDDEDVEEEADEVVPDGIEEVELARISLEQTERELNLLLDCIRDLSASSDVCGDTFPSTEKDGDLWMLTGGKARLVQGLKTELGNKQLSRKAASASLRMALQKAAQLRLLEKEKNKSPSYAMRVSLKINKVVWSMLLDGKSFAEAEINNMIYDFDRDYKDIGVAQFTTRSFVLRNCLPNAKSDMVLSPWNPPPEWGKKVMLRVDAKQGTPKDGCSPIELLQVDIYPLKIYLTEAMYRMMWGYLFPEEEQDSQRRQEVWKVSTTSGSKRAKKGTSVPEATAASSKPTKESEATHRIITNAASSPTVGGNQAPAHGDSSKVTKMQNLKANIVGSSNSELRRTSSFDRTWEENVAESVANELVLQAHSSSTSSSKSGSFSLTQESQHSVNEESSKNKLKDYKAAKIGRLTTEEKKVVKTQDEKRPGPRKMREFHNIKISQVELLVTYEGSRFPISDVRLLMDTFHRDEFIGTWRRLFSRVKKHIIWGVLKSVTGMQGKKFKDKGPSQREPIMASVPDSHLNLSDDGGDQAGKSDKFPVAWVKRPSDGAGDGFVTSVRGLFSSQRRKAKAFVLRTMRGEADDEFHGEWSESEADFSPFARQLTITKAKKLIRRHTKKLRSKGQKDSDSNSQLRESLPASPRDTSPYESDSSSASSPSEDAHE